MTIQTGSSSNNLVVLLQALGNSVGLTVVTDGVPVDKTVNYNISNKPFREVWDLLIRLNDLDFEILGNDIVVVGPKSVVDKFRPAPPVELPKVVAEPVVRSFYTVKTDADSVIKFLQETAKDVSITRFGSSRLIAISGTAAQQQEVSSLLQVIDVVTTAPTTPVAESTERRFYGTNLSADEVAAFLKAEVPGAQINRVGQSRTLSITATAQQHDEIATLLATIDPPPPPPAVVPAPEPTERRFYTANMAPEDLVAFLKAEVPSAVVNRVGTTRTLSITATAKQQEEIATLLASVDPAPQPVQVDNAPAVPAAEPPVRRFYTTNIAPDEIITFLKAEVPGATINRVGTTRTLSITATAKQQEEIATLLSSVDIAPEQPAPVVRIQQIFKLSNAKADDLKAVLTQTFAANNNANNANNDNPNLIIVNPNANANNANNAQPQDVATQAPDIISDVRTNSLIVRGTQAQLNQISDAILALDKRVPQVNVQVRIQEITRTAANTLGLDWTAPFGNFSTLRFGAEGIKSVFNAANNLVGFNLGATLEAMERQNLLKRVDDSSLTLQSGQAEPATIKSGGTLTVSLVGAGVTIERSLDYGVTVNISNLQVSNDGTITMKVNASVKNFTTAPTDPELINLTNNEASTLLSFKSGSTVLLGGLLSINKKDNTTGIPVLSSIPVIGGLFKKTEIEDKETQLMLVITANTVE
ncbi:type II secretion system protein GspD [Deinococcus misasensis]|uniref:type II secretion system protein GspD n=1 Tax=Deinococcus misasensis TaxID=392413 RepID=UPI00146FEBCC|nr:secretin N-terminal domain-containing protein [Deinococcus misasensis]